jgi:hypothetical protein
MDREKRILRSPAAFGSLTIFQSVKMIRAGEWRGNC